MCCSGRYWPIGTPIGLLEGGLEWEGAARLRLGYAVDRFLSYVAGGVGFGSLKTSSIGPGGNVEDEFDETNVGWTLGAGVEYAFTDNLTGRTEYRPSRL